MKTYARLEGSQVVELLSTDGDISQMFHPDFVWIETPVGADVSPGWSYSKGDFFAPIAPKLDDADLKAMIAERRWRQTQAGTIAEGLHLDTGDSGLVKITSAALEASRDKSYACEWKLADGTWVDLDAPKLLAISGAIRSYIQACFDRERELCDAVDAGNFKAEMLEEGWPA